MPERNDAATSTGERDFVITRDFDAPAALVFEVWTQPEHFSQWWGPRAMTNTITKMDVRPGGSFRIVMHAPGGIDYPFTGTYRDVVKNQRLSWVGDLSEHPDSWHDAIDPTRDKSKPHARFEHLTTITFEEIAGKTRVTVVMRFESETIRDRFAKFGMSRGWSESFDRLSELLAKK